MTTLASLFTNVYNPIATPWPAGIRWPYSFGVELELEDVRNRARDEDGYYIPPSGWEIHNDASLRNGVEYVTAGPMGGSDLESAISNFYDAGLTFTAGPRTSTHIHVNMMDATVEALRSMIVMVYTMEDAIYLAAEGSRKWGGYSVSLQDMQPSRLRNILNAPNTRTFMQATRPARNNERYYGFNCNIDRHGTVEFRYFPGGPDQATLESWVDLVCEFKTASGKYSVEQLGLMINAPEDLVRFMYDNFPKWADTLLSKVSAEAMFSQFNTVMALAGDEENPELPGNNIVYLTPALLRFVNKSVLKGNEQAVAYLESSLPKAGVLANVDWQYYLSNAKGFVSPVPTFRSSFDSNPFEVEDSWHDDEEDEYHDAEAEEHPPASPDATITLQSLASREHRMLTTEELEQTERQIRERANNAFWYTYPPSSPSN